MTIGPLKVPPPPAFSEPAPASESRPDAGAPNAGDPVTWAQLYLTALIAKLETAKVLPSHILEIYKTELGHLAENIEDDIRHWTSRPWNISRGGVSS